MLVVMTQPEVKQVLDQRQGTHLLMARLLYGSGLRLMECVRLRAKDLDFERRKIYVRSLKGCKDRITIFPSSILYIIPFVPWILHHFQT